MRSRDDWPDTWRFSGNDGRLGYFEPRDEPDECAYERDRPGDDSQNFGAGHVPMLQLRLLVELLWEER